MQMTGIPCKWLGCDIMNPEHNVWNDNRLGRMQRQIIVIIRNHRDEMSFSMNLLKSSVKYAVTKDGAMPINVYNETLLA
jgi:hypothetical protein